MLVKFTLSMPGVNSWNNRWSGEEYLYARVRKFNKSDCKNLETILEEGYFSYDFGDGWRAGISIEKIDSKEAARVRKNSRGFYGYDWMIDSILSDGYIHI